MYETYNAILGLSSFSDLSLQYTFVITRRYVNWDLSSLHHRSTLCPQKVSHEFLTVTLKVDGIGDKCSTMWH